MYDFLHLLHDCKQLGASVFTEFPGVIPGEFMMDVIFITTAMVYSPPWRTSACKIPK